MAEVDPCNSCLKGYNNKERIPKILSCYHTYCKSCLESFMFEAGVITCLSCSKTTPAESVASLPENPYLRPEEVKRSGGGAPEEVYYSDSDDDSAKPSRGLQNGNNNNGAHVQGVKDMVVNTQKANIHKINILLESNMNKLEKAKEIRNNKESLMMETISAAKQWKMYLEEIINNNKIQLKNLGQYEANMNILRSQINKMNPMDHLKIKHIHEEALQIKHAINKELDSEKHYELEQSIRKSTVKINFEKFDKLLSSLQAENDTIFMKLASSLESDPGTIFLTTHLLASIFTDKIAQHNVNYKDRLSQARREEGADSSLPLDDVSEYIEFINQHTKAMGINPSNNQATRSNPQSDQNNSAPVQKSQSPPASATTAGSAFPDEWKVVGTKEHKREPKKPLSFSEMAKKPGNPQPTIVRRVPFPEKTIAQTNRPHCFFKVQVDNDNAFRVVFELRPDMAPKMVDNFIQLCKGLPDGRGYAGSRIFRAKANDHVLGGDFENNDGTGGHSAYDEKYFLAEQCPLKDHKGAIRMKGLERTMDGRCRIGSQFMIWVGDLDYKEYRFTLVFGKIVEGFDKLQEVSRIKAVQKSPTSWLLRQTVKIIESGII